MWWVLVRHAEEEEEVEGMGRAAAWHQPGSRAGAGGQHRGPAVGEVLGDSQEECCGSGEPAAQPLSGSGRVRGMHPLLPGDRNVAHAAGKASGGEKRMCKSSEPLG